MWAQRALWAVAAAGPVLLLGWIGIQGRYNTLPFSPPAYSPQHRERLIEYIGPIREFEAISNPNGAAPAPDDLRRVAKIWRDKVREGKLLDVTPPVVDETFDSAADEVRQAKQDLVFELGRYARRVEHTDPAEAAWAFSVVLEVADAGKYSDFPSVRSLGQSQMLALDHLARLLPGLARADQLTVLDSVTRIRREPARLHRLVAHYRAVHLRDLADRGQEGSAVTAIGAFSTLTASVDLGGNPMRSGSRWRVYAGERIELVPISSGVHAATSTERALWERLREAEAQLSRLLRQGPTAQSVR